MRRRTAKDLQMRCMRQKRYSGLLSPIGAQITPGGIHALDQLDLSFASPSLEHLLTRDCIANIGGLFEVEEPVEVIARSELRAHASLVLRNPACEIVRDADVKRHRCVGDDVRGEEAPLTVRLPSRSHLEIL